MKDKHIIAILVLILIIIGITTWTLIKIDSLNDSMQILSNLDWACILTN